LRTDGNPDRTWVEVDLEALRANAREVQRRSAARLCPMVKADGYGLGAVAVARGLEALNPWGYGVVTADEGRALRAAGIARRILVVQPTIAMLEACAQSSLTPVLGGMDEVRRWRSLAPDQPFHVGVDTGMNRGGIWWESFAAECADLAAAAEFEGLATHFHSADRDAASVREQWERFRSCLAALPRRPPLVHASNSAAALGYPEVSADLVRPGIFLYGGGVGDHRPAPVIRWQARIARAAWREAGATVSYGATWTAPRRTCLLSVAAGYADGVRRAVAGRGAMLVGGTRRPIVGAVTMDFTMLASDAAPAEGAAATLIGTDGGATIGLDEFAGWAGTISYEILTGLGNRVQRVYRG